MSAHDMSETGGLREAVEALRAAVDEACPHGTEGNGAHPEGTCEVCDYTFAVDVMIEEALEPFLAAHPASEADPTAGERCPYPEHAQWGWGEDASGDPDPTNCRVCSPATPDAGDASEPDLAEATGYRDTATGELVDASASASEPLSEAECAVLAEVLGKVVRPNGYLAVAVERIVAAREAKARAEAGEQALRDFSDWWDDPDNVETLRQMANLHYRAGGPSMPAIIARLHADRIAREVTR